MTLVIDANVLMQIIPSRGKYHWIWSYYRQGKFHLAVSTDILLEIREVFTRWMPGEIAENIIKTIVENPGTTLVEPSFFWYLIPHDQDDNKYVDCAIAAGADFIITEDKHFKALAKIKFPKVVTYRLSQVRKSWFK